MDEQCPLHPWPLLLCQVQCIACGALCGEHQMENFHCQNFVSTSKALRQRLVREWEQRRVSAEGPLPMKDFMKRIRLVKGRLA